MNPFIRPMLSRREFLARVGMGMGALSFGALAQAQSSSPLAPQTPHFVNPENR